MFILFILVNSEDFLAFLRTYLRILRNRSVNSQFSIHKYFVLTGKVSVSKCGKLCKPWKWPVFCYRIWFIVAYMEERKRGTFFLFVWKRIRSSLSILHTQRRNGMDAISNGKWHGGHFAVTRYIAKNFMYR